MTLASTVVSGVTSETGQSRPLDSGIRMHTLYLGSPGGAGFGVGDLDAIFRAITPDFESFTMVPAYGVYRGKALPSLVIKIGVADSEAVRRVAQRVGRLFAQETVGLELDGAYHPITTD